MVKSEKIDNKRVEVVDLVEEHLQTLKKKKNDGMGRNKE
jgi:hypothetical protein